MKLCFAYITAANEKEAVKIGSRLIEKKLAGCINILGGMKSVYRWKGKIEQGQEVVLIAKTHEKYCRAVIAEVKRLHSYDIPCVLFLPVRGGNADYVKWLKKSMK